VLSCLGRLKAKVVIFQGTIASLFAELDVLRPYTEALQYRASVTPE
jgi:hypothetical protein